MVSDLKQDISTPAFQPKEEDDVDDYNQEGITDTVHSWEIDVLTDE